MLDLFAAGLLQSYLPKSGDPKALDSAPIADICPSKMFVCSEYSEISSLLTGKPWIGQNEHFVVERVQSLVFLWSRESQVECRQSPPGSKDATTSDQRKAANTALR